VDNLVLTRVARELAARLPGCVLRELEQEDSHRFRLTFEGGRDALHLIASLGPELSWIGRAARRWPGPPWSPDRVVVLAARALRGRTAVSVSKAGDDRALRLEFTGGRGLVFELGTRATNFILLGPGGAVEATLRRPARETERLAEGAPYVPRAFPEGRLHVIEAPAAAIDAHLAERRQSGESVPEALRQAVPGFGGETLALLAEESRATGRSIGTVFRERIDALLRGDGEAVIEGPEPPLPAAEGGRFARDAFRLLPWRPNIVRDGSALFSGEDACTTVGLFYEANEAANRLAAHLAGLGAILRSETRRARESADKARASLDSFGDPERPRREGEALLAGLARARREGDTVLVPDPYDEAGGDLIIGAPAGRPLPLVADDLFKKQRRARRGIAAARARIELLDRRRETLAALGERHAAAAGAQDARDLEAAMRDAGLPVGLARSPRAARASAAARAPKLLGVRMIRSVDGITILVGRTGKDNDRLTFKIAAPEDLWLHAQGVPGAHVVVRAAEAQGKVKESTLLHAARLAAWFSDARGEGQVDVQWTRRKNVRRARGPGSGRVVLKRFETVRVRPEPPDGDP
jgi:predicted ribosome quality control (RQC) complex YloA/Tae2 family protein